MRLGFGQSITVALLLVGGCSFPEYTFEEDVQSSLGDGGAHEPVDAAIVLDADSGEDTAQGGTGGVADSGTGGGLEPGDCSDGIRNPDEADVDCGGRCAEPCAVSERCLSNDDCVSLVCTLGSDGAGVCAAPSCTDGVKNGEESAPDCGALGCKPCELNQGCSVDDQCLSGLCRDGFCQPSLQVLYSCVACDYSTPVSAIKSSIEIVNLSEEDVPLGELTVAYYYTKETGSGTFECYASSEVSCGFLSVSTEDYAPKTNEADVVTKISFHPSSGTLTHGGRSGRLNFGLNAGPGSYDQSNDYSFGRDMMDQQANLKIVLFRGTDRIWGELPPSASIK